MIKFILIMVIIIIIIVLYQKKIKIKWSTFFKKGFAPNRGKFGVYCYCGKQGQGKTYSAVEFILNNKDMKIFSNVKSIKGVEYTPIDGFEELLSLRSEHDCLIFYDEIFTALTRTSKINTEVLDFLSQMRKRRIIFITTAQEWLEINITLRRYCRYQIQCRMFSFLGLGILIKTFSDAENMKWSQEDNDYVAPLLETSISKCNKYIADSYDTREEIGSTEKTCKPLEKNNLSDSSSTKVALVPLGDLNRRVTLDNDFWGNVSEEDLDHGDN